MQSGNQTSKSVARTVVINAESLHSDQLHQKLVGEILHQESLKRRHSGESIEFLEANPKTKKSKAYVTVLSDAEIAFSPDSPDQDEKSYSPTHFYRVYINFNLRKRKSDRADGIFYEVEDPRDKESTQVYALLHYNKGKNFILKTSAMKCEENAEKEKEKEKGKGKEKDKGEVSEQAEGATTSDNLFSLKGKEKDRGRGNTGLSSSNESASSGEEITAVPSTNDSDDEIRVVISMSTLRAGNQLHSKLLAQIVIDESNKDEQSLSSNTAIDSIRAYDESKEAYHITLGGQKYFVISNVGLTRQPPHETQGLVYNIFEKGQGKPEPYALRGSEGNFGFVSLSQNKVDHTWDIIRYVAYATLILLPPCTVFVMGCLAYEFGKSAGETITKKARNFFPFFNKKKSDPENKPYVLDRNKRDSRVFTEDEHEDTVIINKLKIG